MEEQISETGSNDGIWSRYGVRVAFGTFSHRFKSHPSSELHLISLKQDPPFVWTEDYQVELMSQYFKGFDYLYDQGFFIGEMIWNFADFATPQGWLFSGWHIASLLCK